MRRHARRRGGAMTDRELIIKWWDEAWTEGLWAAAWSKSIDGLRPQQAGGEPPGGVGGVARGAGGGERRRGPCPRGGGGGPRRRRPACRADRATRSGRSWS